MRRLGALSLILGLTLLAHSPARANTPYTIQTIARIGDTVGEAQIRIQTNLWIDALNDKGQIVFRTGSSLTRLIKYADGNFIPIVIGGGDAPGGKWPGAVDISLLAMNQLGNVVFVAPVTVAGKGTIYGLFMWDDQARQVIPVVQKGMPATSDAVFDAIGGFRTTINNRNDIAFTAQLKTSQGKRVDWGVYFRAGDGQISPVAFPDQPLPEGGQSTGALHAWIDDRGRVAFLAVSKGRSWPSANAYVWENGALTLLASSGTDAPGAGKFVRVDGAWLNNKNQSVLIQAVLDNASTGPRALYRFANGQLLPVAIPGQPMPGGGTFQTHQWLGVSYANDPGQHAFVASVLEDGHRRTAAYLLDPDGKLSLLLKSGTPTEVGQITNIGEPGTTTPPEQRLGVGLNNKGQVALPVEIDGKTNAIVLLTPVQPAPGA